MITHSAFSGGIGALFVGRPLQLWSVLCLFLCTMDDKIESPLFTLLRFGFDRPELNSDGAGKEQGDEGKEGARLAQSRCSEKTCRILQTLSCEQDEYVRVSLLHECRVSCRAKDSHVSWFCSPPSWPTPASFRGLAADCPNCGRQCASQRLIEC